MSTSSSQPSFPVEKIIAASDKYPKLETVTFDYGTAGFRTKGHLLPSVLFRLGLLATLRSKKLDGKAVGVMITASHNPAEDNGAKVIDPRGEMLDPLWETQAKTLSNLPTSSSLPPFLTDLASSLKIDLSRPSIIYYGYDTRASSPELKKALEEGMKAIQAGNGSGMGESELIDLGVVTTPCVHYAVKGRNVRGEEKEGYGELNEEGYLKKMAEAFNHLMAGKGPASPLLIDCANGVGALSLAKFAPLIESNLPIRLICTDTADPSVLNSQCGADYVKTNQRLPPALVDILKRGERACSLDGDADRVVYYYLTGSRDVESSGGSTESEGKFRLLDGDKIATLAAGFIGDLVKQAGLGERLKIGVVQTAYANGSSSQYLKSAGLPVRCVPTGVKHLHHAAEKYDIGVYFEANGHGTVLFSPETIDVLAKYEPKTPGQDNAVTNLKALTSLINQAVGDAISDFLLVEVILAHKRWEAEEWDAGYEDLPNRLVKVTVPDRMAFTTEDAERKLVTPQGLQGQVEEIVRKFEKGRSFVRPSGTEDCVRVYAEASTRIGADELAAQVSQLVSDVARSGAGQ